MVFVIAKKVSQMNNSTERTPDEFSLPKYYCICKDNFTSDKHISRLSLKKHILYTDHMEMQVSEKYICSVCEIEVGTN